MAHWILTLTKRARVSKIQQWSLTALELRHLLGLPVSSSCAPLQLDMRDDAREIAACHFQKPTALSPGISQLCAVNFRQFRVIATAAEWERSEAIAADSPEFTSVETGDERAGALADEVGSA